MFSAVNFFIPAYGYDQFFTVERECAEFRRVYKQYIKNLEYNFVQFSSNRFSPEIFKKSTCFNFNYLIFQKIFS